MLLLALDTASAAVSVALHDGEKVLAVCTGASAPRHVELLTPLIIDLLAEVGAKPAELTRLAVGVGPGPFTGLRVGLVTARVLGLALDREVVGVCSLDAVAAGAVRAGLSAPAFLVATDARRREVYWARYELAEGPAGLPVRVGEPQVSAAAELPRAGLPVVGRGAKLYPAELGNAELGGEGLAGLNDAVLPLDPSAADLAELAVFGAPYLLPAEPLYLRRPDASRPGARKRVLP